MARNRNRRRSYSQAEYFDHVESAILVTGVWVICLVVLAFKALGVL